jgi:hypothetical protein
MEVLLLHVPVRPSVIATLGGRLQGDLITVGITYSSSSSNRGRLLECRLHGTTLLSHTASPSQVPPTRELRLHARQEFRIRAREWAA